MPNNADVTSLVRETSWFEEALQEGRQEGLQQGLQQQLVRALAHRFGPISENIVARLEGIPSEGLEALMDLALDAESLDDFVRRLPENGPAAETVT